MVTDLEGVGCEVVSEEVNVEADSEGVGSDRVNQNLLSSESLGSWRERERQRERGREGEILILQKRCVCMRSYDSRPGGVVTTEVKTLPSAVTSTV